MKQKYEWLNVVNNSSDIKPIENLMTDKCLNTVCKEAKCPNIGECYNKRTATFLIMGKQCTRNCGFCNVSKNSPECLDINEPDNVAQAALQMQLKHIVITSVTRDDLTDCGANHYVEVVAAIRRVLPECTIELLIPDMKGEEKLLDIIINSKPDILGHNLETVPSLYSAVRPEADYDRSVRVLKYIKDKSNIITKTGIMVGLGETGDEVISVMNDVAKIKCEILTIGQYLRPSKKHLKVMEYIRPEVFEQYKTLGLELGIKYVYSAPLVRSSYNASEVFDALRRIN